MYPRCIRLGMRTLPGACATAILRIWHEARSASGCNQTTPIPGWRLCLNLLFNIYSRCCMLLVSLPLTRWCVLMITKKLYSERIPRAVSGEYFIKIGANFESIGGARRTHSERTRPPKCGGTRPTTGELGPALCLSSTNDVCIKLI